MKQTAILVGTVMVAMLAMTPAASADAMTWSGIVAYPNGTWVPHNTVLSMENLNQSYVTEPWWDITGDWGGYNGWVDGEKGSESDYMKINASTVDGQWYGEITPRLSDIWNAGPIGNVYWMNITVYPTSVPDTNWTQFHYDIANTGNSPANAPDTNHTKWISENISAAEGSQAIITGDSVFAYISVTGADDAIYALNRATGNVEWSATFPGETKDWGSSTTPAYADGVVFAAAGYNVTGFDAATGTKLQEIAFPDGGYLSNGGVTVADGIVFVGSGSGANYYALNANDLTDTVWNYTTNLSRAYSTPAVADDRVIFGDAGWGYDDGYLYCVNESTGAEVWSTGLTGLVWGSATIDAANNRVYVATAVDWDYDEGKLYALAFDTGAVQWSADINYTSSTPAVSGEYIYVAASGAAPGVTYCFNSSGVEQWNVPSGSRKISPAVADGKLFTGNVGLSGMASEGTEGIDVYDATTGALIWQHEHAGSSPSVAEDADGNGIVVSIGADGMVYAFGDTMAFDCTVTLTNGTTFAFVPSNNASASYDVNSTTDLGALTATGLAFNASDTWYEAYGTFWLESISGIENEVWPNSTWCIYINDAPAPKGLGGNELEDGDNVKFYFCPANATTYAYITEDASYLVNITVSVTLRKGDANNDGTVTTADAVLALQMAVGSVAPNEEADVNRDGAVTSLDALMIMQAVAGSITI